MSNEYATSPVVAPKMRITAGTAFKFGFFGALGVVVLYLIVSVIIGAIVAVLFAAGTLPSLADLLNR